MLAASIEKETKTLDFQTVAVAFPELLASANQETVRELGGLALGETCEIIPVETKSADSSTMLSALHQARFGDKAAIETIKVNVQTDVAERLYKAGHVTEVVLSYGEQGISQNNRKLRDIHKNTLRHMELNDVMKQRTELEFRNAVLFEELEAAAVLDEYDAVVFSMTPHDQETRTDYRFFTSTDSVSIQYLKKTNQKLVLETAMVAGKKHANTLRHDSAVIGTILAGAGVDDTAISDNESLNHVLLVPKTQFNGIDEVVELYDDLAGGTFYGQLKERQDYKEYRKVSRQREAFFDQIVESVVEDLLAEAHNFQRPIDVIERLDKLSDKYCVLAAIGQEDIDLAVFGVTAAAHIKEARGFAAAGDMGGAERSLAKAHEVSTSSSCPTKLVGALQSSSESGNSTTAAEVSSGKKKMTCPFCKERITGDPCGSEINCTKCSASTKHSSSENRKRARIYKQNKKNRHKQKGILFSWNSQR